VTAPPSTSPFPPHGQADRAPAAAPRSRALVQYALLAGTAYLARRFGTRPVYQASVVAFTAASALCALAPQAGVLVGTRALQGLVAAPLVPLAMSMLLGGRGARGISPLAGVLLFLGLALGPTAGGALIAAAGWRAIFLVNVPVGLLAAVAVRAIPAALAPGRQPGARFDLPGLILLAAGLTGLLLGPARERPRAGPPRRAGCRWPRAPP
jgi:MFS family permease